MDFTEFENLQAFVVFLATGGASVFANVIVSWFLEDWGYWQSLSAVTKRIAVTVFAVLTGVLAAIILQDPAWLAKYDYIFTALALGLTSLFAGQVAHRKNDKRIPPVG